MKPQIVKANTLHEYQTPERCFIYETCGLVATHDPTVSIARARVQPSITTKTHHLVGVQEIYVITQGEGKVQIGDLPPTEVTVGDTVIIPAGVKQKIANTGQTDLVFYCICTPAFTETCYCNDEPEV
jgi:mannose-6-phosphate isomerase-like protein (cupin superfamily)